MQTRTMEVAMRLAEVIGKVTLSKHHESLHGATWLVAVPLSLEGIRGDSAGRRESIVVYDERGAGEGALIAVSEGAEAAAPFWPEVKPVSAYNTAILEHIEAGE